MNSENPAYEITVKRQEVFIKKKEGEKRKGKSMKTLKQKEDQEKVIKLLESKGNIKLINDIAKSLPGRFSLEEEGNDVSLFYHYSKTKKKKIATILIMGNGKSTNSRNKRVRLRVLKEKKENNNKGYTNKTYMKGYVR